MVRSQACTSPRVSRLLREICECCFYRDTRLRDFFLPRRYLKVRQKHLVISCKCDRRRLQNRFVYTISLAGPGLIRSRFYQALSNNTAQRDPRQKESPPSQGASQELGFVLRTLTPKHLDHAPTSLYYSWCQKYRNRKRKTVLERGIN